MKVKSIKIFIKTKCLNKVLSRFIYNIAILIDLVFKKVKNYYLQVCLEKCK